jgi:hypothetical protein
VSSLRDFVISAFDTSGVFKCSQHIFFGVDHDPDPTVIVYSPYLMVLLYGLLFPSTQLDPTVKNDPEEDQQSGMIAGSQLARCLKLSSSSAMEIACLVVELMPTVHLLVGDHRRSMWIVEP